MASEQTSAPSDDAGGPRRRGSSGETQVRIIRAAMETLEAEGIKGTTARAVARAGGFNQALIYYHFDSLEGLFFAVIEHVNKRRLAYFGPKLEAVETFVDLVDVAIELQSGEPDPSERSAMALVVAGWSGTSDQGPKVLAELKPWDRAVADAIRRITAGSSLSESVPVDALAHTMSALFLGLVLLARLDPDDGSTAEVFDALGQAGDMLGRFMSAFPANS